MSLTAIYDRDRYIVHMYIQASFKIIPIILGSFGTELHGIQTEFRYS